MIRYIQRLGQGCRETVDELRREDFPTLSAFRSEVRRLVHEYRFADPSAAYYSSRRPCANWSR